MLGWHVSIYRQRDGGASPASFDSAQGERLAVWQTDVGGLKWLRDLAGEGKAVDLDGNGYPWRFTAQARDLLPHAIPDPPAANENWLLDELSSVTPAWEGKTVTDPAAAERCSPDEWLLVEAWDES
jgi:hypothetical protein